MKSRNHPFAVFLISLLACLVVIPTARAEDETATLDRVIDVLRPLVEGSGWRTSIRTLNTSQHDVTTSSAAKTTDVGMQASKMLFAHSTHPCASFSAVVGRFQTLKQANKWLVLQRPRDVRPDFISSPRLPKLTSTSKGVGAQRSERGHVAMFEQPFSQRTPRMELIVVVDRFVVLLTTTGVADDQIPKLHAAVDAIAATIRSPEKAKQRATLETLDVETPTACRSIRVRLSMEGSQAKHPFGELSAFAPSQSMTPPSRTLLALGPPRRATAVDRDWLVPIDDQSRVALLHAAPGLDEACFVVLLPKADRRVQEVTLYRTPAAWRVSGRVALPKGVTVHPTALTVALTPRKFPGLLPTPALDYAHARTVIGYSLMQAADENRPVVVRADRLRRTRVDADGSWSVLVDKPGTYYAQIEGPGLRATASIPATPLNDKNESTEVTPLHRVFAVDLHVECDPTASPSLFHDVLVELDGHTNAKLRRAGPTSSWFYASILADRGESTLRVHGLPGSPTNYKPLEIPLCVAGPTTIHIPWGKAPVVRQVTR